MITKQDIEKAIQSNQITNEITQYFLTITENDKKSIFDTVFYDQMTDDDLFEFRRQIHWILSHMKNTTLSYILVDISRPEKSPKITKTLYEILQEVSLSRKWSDEDLLKMMHKLNRKSLFKTPLISLLLAKRSFDQIFKLTLQSQIKPFLINTLIAEHDKKELPGNFQWYQNLTKEEQKKLIEIILIYGKDDERIEIIFHDVKKLIPVLFKEQSWELLMLKVLDIGNIKCMKLINEIKPYSELFGQHEYLIKSYYKDCNGFNFNNFLSIEKFHWLRENNCPRTLLNEMMEAMYLIKNHTEEITIEHVINYDKQFPDGFDKEVFAHVLSIYASKTKVNEGMNKKAIVIYDYLQENRPDLTQWLDNIITHGREKVVVKKYIGEKETSIDQISTHKVLNRLKMERFNKKLEEELNIQVEKPKNKL